MVDNYSNIIANEDADRIYQKLSEIYSGDTDFNNSAKLIHRIFSWIIESLTASEGIHFPTLFTRVAYVGTRYRLNPRLLYHAHQLRRLLERSQSDQHTQDLGLWVITTMLSKYSETQIPRQLEKLLESLDFDSSKTRTSKGFKRVMSGLIISIDFEKYIATFIDEEEGDVEHQVLFNVADRNEPFTNNLWQAYHVFGNRFLVNLIDVEIDEEDHLLPRAFVIQPDYLMDVSSVAECFNYNGTEPVQYLLRKLMPSQSSIHMILGNIVNFILDRLCDNTSLKFEDLLADIFHMYPLAFAKMDNETVKDLINKAKTHFGNLKRSIEVDFINQGIDCENVYLEPSFYSRDYGLQGRLDVFHHSFEHDRADIIELKSGKTFRPNIYGINANHYIQTLCYDLIIRSVYKRSLKLSNYILYSSADDKSLKYAPSVVAQQHEALRLRNQLVVNEFLLEKVDQADSNILRSINTVALPDLKGYVQRDVARIEKVFHYCDQTVLKYYESFLAFVSREHHLAKIGEHGEDKNNGLASLWLENASEKQERFAMLESLEIVENQSDQSSPILRLRQHAAHRKLSSFRVGDIVVFYPKEESQRGVLQHQIFKCNIIEINDTEVSIKLRSKQNNQSIFKQYQYWNLEPDFLDSSFNMMYRGLFQFLESSKEYQQQILTQIPAKQPTHKIELPKYPISEEQRSLLIDMLSAQDYYLLWGPPGTGKTSYLLRYASQYLVEETKETILLLAYTNRAVDQICEAMESIDSVQSNGYIRIGSSHATDEKFRYRLLRDRIKQLHSRKEIKALLESTRVIVSTVSSIQSRSELFDLKKFDTIIVDEASQILEPMLVGLLNRADRYILIGDHRQLPAVVVQENSKTKISITDLNNLGIVDMRDSLFERMYKRCVGQQWSHAYGIVSNQGRMHEQLMQFPNKHFYQDNLNIIEGVNRLTADFNSADDDSLTGILQSQRLIYIDTPIDDEFDIKTNLYEALLVSNIIDKLDRIYLTDDQKPTIGVITPYKAQIAQVLKQLENDEVHNDLISIDTVERYQGSSRDIVIISLCTNVARQIDRMSQVSSEGIDRKLNVALTRAKEQIIIIGSEKLLSQNAIYRELISSYYKFDYTF